ncbi:MAG: septum site-determining protein MinC [Lachnospiraceae bacterium]|nr:septum site-determining protein MinC [Lachnospiraceae bacterium]
MSGIISLKGNRYGLSVNIASDASFDDIKTETAEYFKHASKMFGKEKIAIGFEGRPLNDEEREELIGIIRNSCSLDILCIMDFNSDTEERFRRAVQKYNEPEEIEIEPVEETVAAETEDTILEEFEVVPSEEVNAETSVSEPPEDEDFIYYSREDIPKIARFYKGYLRSGMVINEKSSLVILGDINAGSEIYSEGSIIILGSLKGKAYAGINGNENAFVFALNMDPIQIRIADKIGRASDSVVKKKEKKEEHEPKIALVKDNAIAIELASRSVLNDIIL